MKIRYFRTTPQQADGAFARKFCAQSSANHEFFRNKTLHPFRVDKETPKQAIGEFFPIKFVSIKNNQIFGAQNPIEIKIEARDAKGKIVPDEFDLLIDGKEYAEINNSLCENCEPRSFIWRPPYFRKGNHTVQVVAKNWRGTELGRSEIINITIK